MLVAVILGGALSWSNDWESSLTDIDTAIEAHKKEFDRKEDEPGKSLVEMRSLGALILGKLGRADEAEAARELAAIEPTPYPSSIYQMFHDKLRDVKLK